MSGLSGLTSLFTSPRDRLQHRLEDAISDGKIKAADKDALSTALDDIDKSMEDAAKSDTGKSPADMKTRLEGLIDDKVKAGKLTSDQADELKTMLDPKNHAGKDRGGAALEQIDKTFASLVQDGTISTKDANAVKAGLDKVKKLFAALGPSSNPQDSSYLFKQVGAVLGGLVDKGTLNSDQAAGVMQTLVSAKGELGTDGGGPDFKALSKLTPADVGGGDAPFAGLRYGTPTTDSTISDFVAKLVDDVNSMGFSYDTSGKNTADGWPLLLDFQA